nr:hypothetical protein [Tanacetum cinerariifolium]
VVSRGSPVHRYGLYSLQWIVEVNTKPTPDLDAFVNVTKVVNKLTSPRELVDLINNVDIVFHSIPIDGLSETDADGSFLHENWNKDLKLFSTSEDGGHRLLQVVPLKALIVRINIRMSNDNKDHAMELIHEEWTIYIYRGKLTKHLGMLLTRKLYKKAATFMEAKGQHPNLVAFAANLNWHKRHIKCIYWYV